ncbi:hypothetical protein H4S02_003456 [Coemansia sp. RSA 2611]|nr:hypothetical protein H4S02_003456 [Coemansia sp. RSA 2611]
MPLDICLTLCQDSYLLGIASLGTSINVTFAQLEEISRSGPYIYMVGGRLFANFPRTAIQNLLALHSPLSVSMFKQFIVKANVVDSATSNTSVVHTEAYAHTTFSVVKIKVLAVLRIRNTGEFVVAYDGCVMNDELVIEYLNNDNFTVDITGKASPA